MCSVCQCRAGPQCCRYKHRLRQFDVTRTCMLGRRAMGFEAIRALRRQTDGERNKLFVFFWDRARCH